MRSLYLIGSTGTWARFLGHDAEGRAVFRDLDHQGLQPLRAPAGHRPPEAHRPDTWTGPAVFRLSRGAARRHYGHYYEAEGGAT